MKSWRVTRPGSDLHSRDRRINRSIKNVENVDKVDQTFPLMRPSFVMPRGLFEGSGVGSVGGFWDATCKPSFETPKFTKRTLLNFSLFFYLVSFSILFL